MSVPDQAPAFPITYVELLARARKHDGGNRIHKMYAALKHHTDTAEWLQAMRPFAFIKGATTKAVPAATTHWQVQARKTVIDAVFATAKTLREREISVPGRGKTMLRPSDMLQPDVHYGLSDGELDLSALTALQTLTGLSYTLDAERIQQDADYAEAQKDWAHGEHALQRVDGDLKALGIFADTPEDAAAQLLEMDEPELLNQVNNLIADRDTHPVRDYGSFKLPAWRAPDPPKGRSIHPNQMPTGINAALRNATLISGSWDALHIQRPLKAQAFDRVVELFTALFKRTTPTVIAANTDDLIGKAAVMAARTLCIKTVAVQLAGWEFKPASLSHQFCDKSPKGTDVQLARHQQHHELSELVSCVVILGHDDQAAHLSACAERQRKPVRILDTSWANHHGLN